MEISPEISPSVMCCPLYCLLVEFYKFLSMSLTDLHLHSQECFHQQILIKNIETAIPFWSWNLNVLSTKLAIFQIKMLAAYKFKYQATD